MSRDAARGKEGPIGAKNERAEKGNGGVGKGHIIGPRGVEGGVGWVIWAEENLVTKKNGSVGGVRRVAMPFTPPPSTSVARGAVVRVTTKEIDRESTAGTAVGGGRFGEAVLEVDKDEIPAGAKGTLREVADEEHAVGTGNNGVKEQGWRGG